MPTQKPGSRHVAGLGIPVRKYFVTGVSEGGLVAAKSLEDDAAFSGGVEVCGPIGSFQKQIDYFSDVRVLFDYFFPGVLITGTPGESAINIPPASYTAAIVHSKERNIGNSSVTKSAS